MTLGFAVKHLRQRQLLLVAARQRRRADIKRTGTDAEVLDRRLKRSHLGAGPEPGLRVVLKRHQCEVFAEAELHVQALALAVLA